MYQNLMQYPGSQTGVDLYYSGQNRFQTAVPMPSQPSPNFIFGRFVNNLEDITAYDVPMDGTAGYFPTKDGSFIFKKQWNGDGTITTIKYVPDISPVEETPKQMTMDELKDYIDGRFNEIIKSLSNKPVRNAQYINNSKGVTNNEQSN